jgi:DNA-binding HxlR family transcriptional regulator
MSRRSYRQNCALARTSDLIGERWSLLLIRDLLVGPKRYNELAQSLAGMGTNLLASRLRDLEAAGIVEKCVRGSGGHAYALTAAGRDLEPAVLALVRWGLTHLPGRVEGYYHQDDWDLVALKSAFQPGRAEGLSTRVQFVSESIAAWVDIRDGEMTVGTGASDEPDLEIGGTVEDLFVTSKDPAALLSAGTPHDLERFMGAFAL